MQRKLLLDIPIIRRLYPSLLRRLLKLFKLNRRLWKIKNFKMCLDFLDSVDREIILKNEYEPKQIDYFLMHAKNNKINQIIDIGANCGYFSFYMANNISDAKIHAFEPIPEVYRRFAETIKASRKKIRDNIKLLNVGLSDKKSTVTMALPIKNNFIGTGGARFVDINYNASDNEFIKQVEFQKGDDLFTSTNQTWGLKIDVEGHEINTLKGMKKFLSANKVFIQIEIFDENFEAVNAYLLKKKFSVVSQINDSSKTDYFYSNFKNFD
ncbi:FkbM family methyltransferase [Methylophilaceae bacterium]|nr:FkbM family methyltransferase [Methylophilaceae bacterium]